MDGLKRVRARAERVTCVRSGRRTSHTATGDDDIMFGKPRDIDDTDTLDTIDGFFGDETAAEAIVEVHDLQHRVEQVEAQINSQFTSLATYAQIAQEQVEMARAEARRPPSAPSSASPR
jgi:hypothetical protein